MYRSGRSCTTSKGPWALPPVLSFRYPFPSSLNLAACCEVPPSLVDLRQSVVVPASSAVLRLSRILVVTYAVGQAMWNPPIPWRLQLVTPAPRNATRLPADSERCRWAVGCIAGRAPSGALALALPGWWQQRRRRGHSGATPADPVRGWPGRTPRMSGLAGTDPAGTCTWAQSRNRGRGPGTPTPRGPTDALPPR